MIGPGNSSTTVPMRKDRMAAALIIRENMERMERVSPLPQYCAASTDAAPDRPNVVMVNMKNGWLARDEADRRTPVLSACPSITVSIMLVTSVMRFCRAMGMAMVKMRR